MEVDRTEEPKPLFRHDRTVGINRRSHPAPAAVIRERKPSDEQPIPAPAPHGAHEARGGRPCGRSLGRLHGAADSIVYVKGNAIWASSPDGKRQVQLAADRRFASPSQADDGTIVALGDDNHLYRFTRGGKPIGKPVLTWLGLNGGSGFAGPYRPRVSPDGTKVAFTFMHSQGPRPGHRHIAGGRRHVATPTSTG